MFLCMYFKEISSASTELCALHSNKCSLETSVVLRRPHNVCRSEKGDLHLKQWSFVKQGILIHFTILS